jgi:hypothetical protein
MRKERDEKRDKIHNKKSEANFTNTAYDVREVGNGGYEYVVISYNPETKLAKVVSSKKLPDRTIGMVFNKRKVALENLNK